MRIKAPFPADLAAASGHGCPALYLRKNVADWPMPKMRCKLINAQVALFNRDGDGATLVEMVDWFVLDIRVIDQTSAARLLPRQVTLAEIADPTGVELRSFSPKDIANIVAALIP